MNPDADDGMFGTLKRRMGSAVVRVGETGWVLDRDVDGLAGEDGPDGKSGDGRISRMRIRDPEGGMIPDPNDCSPPGAP